MRWVIVAIVLLILAEVSTKHECTDKTHADCDGMCVCDGMECN